MSPAALVALGRVAVPRAPSAVELPAVDFSPRDPIVAGVAWPYVDQANPAYSPQHTVTALALPNSHLITLVDRYDEDELIATGSHVADDSANFSIGANVSFVQRLAEGEVFIRTFERGAGLTESCGSGVSASRATLSRLGLVDPDARVLVRNPGGPSRSWLQQTGDVWQPVLEGNATVIRRTEVETADVLGDAPLGFTVEAFMDETRLSRSGSTGWPSRGPAGQSALYRPPGCTADHVRTK